MVLVKYLKDAFNQQMKSPMMNLKLNQQISVKIWRLHHIMLQTSISSRNLPLNYTNATSAISSTLAFYQNQHNAIQKQLETMNNTLLMKEQQLEQQKHLYVSRFDQLTNDLKEARTALRFDTDKQERAINRLKSECAWLKGTNQRLEETNRNFRKHKEVITAQKKEIEYLQWSRNHTEAVNIQLKKDLDQMHIELQMSEQNMVVLETQKLMMLERDSFLQPNNTTQFHQYLHKRKLNNLLDAKAMKDGLMKTLNKKRYITQNKLARRILGESIATHPSVSFESHSQIVCLARAQILAEAGILNGKMTKMIAE